MADNRIYGLERQIAVLEDRMETKQTEFKTDIGRLAEQVAKRDARIAKRDFWIIVTGLALALSFVAVLIRTML